MCTTAACLRHEWAPFLTWSHPYVSSPLAALSRVHLSQRVLPPPCFAPPTVPSAAGHQGGAGVPGEEGLPPAAAARCQVRRRHDVWSQLRTARAHARMCNAARSSAQLCTADPACAHRHAHAHPHPPPTRRMRKGHGSIAQPPGTGCIRLQHAARPLLAAAGRMACEQPMAASTLHVAAAAAAPCCRMPAVPHQRESVRGTPC